MKRIECHFGTALVIVTAFSVVPLRGRAFLMRVALFLVFSSMRWDQAASVVHKVFPE